MINYSKEIITLQKKAHAKNKSTINQVTHCLKNTIDQAGILFVFGSGHSSILAEEAFHRAGGLVPVYPIFSDFLSPRVSPHIASRLERVKGLAKVLFQKAQPHSGDLMFLVSQSGINPAAIEMALECKKAKIKTVAFTSLKHSRNVKSRHSSGKKLYELCDLVLDNLCPVGDALIEINTSAYVAASSTLINIFLYNIILTKTCLLLKKEGKSIPVYKSVNIRGGEEHNRKLEWLYKTRIELLR